MAETSEKKAGSGERDGTKYLLNKLAAETVALLTTDAMTLEVARWVEMKKDGRASAHLDHYLTGKGADLKVDLARVIREDDGVRAKLHAVISADLARGISQGSVPIPQPVYTNKDWQFAIGSMNINWTAGPPSPKGKVRLGFRNRYRWHPTEKRMSQAIHIAADNLKAKGAADYDMVGVCFFTPSAAAGRAADRAATKASGGESRSS